jgi:hypothetical protein
LAFLYADPPLKMSTDKDVKTMADKNVDETPLVQDKAIDVLKKQLSELDLSKDEDELFKLQLK